MVITMPRRLTYDSANTILRGLPFNESPKVIFDFSSLVFSHPLAMLMVAGGLRKLTKRRSQLGLSTAVSGLSSGIAAHTYLEHLGFFDFINLPNRNKLGSAKGSPRYIPIKRISRADFRVAEGDSKGLHDALIEAADVIALVLAGTDLKEYEVKRGLAYSIKEIVRNVFEHSGAGHCYVAGQRWGEGAVEIVIMDEGVGISKTLSESFVIESDRQALEYSIKPGVSRMSKVLDALNTSDNSGFGLYVLSQVGKRFGRFVLGSGMAALRHQQGTKLQFDATSFSGTFVGITLNERPSNFRSVLDEIVESGEAEAKLAGFPAKASESSRTT